VATSIFNLIVRVGLMFDFNLFGLDQAPLLRGLRRLSLGMLELGIFEPWFVCFHPVNPLGMQLLGFENLDLFGLLLGLGYLVAVPVCHHFRLSLGLWLRCFWLTGEGRRGVRLGGLAGCWVGRLFPIR